MMFNWWIFLETVKLLLIFVSLVFTSRTLGTILLLVLLVIATLGSYYKTIPLLRKVMEKIMVEDNYENAVYLGRIRTILGTLLLLDLLPFMPFIQAILRYWYYRQHNKVEKLFN